jgi:prepilin-type N-terminal cleavage/methylation domain-containing protein
MSARFLRRPGRTGGEDGFTLIEVLVSMVVLAILVAMLPGAFRFAHATWGAAAKLDRRAGYAVAGGFLRARLAEAMPLFEQGEAGLRRVAFQGTSASLSFVAASPNGPAGGGLYRFTLEMGPGGQRANAASALLVKVAPYQAVANPAVEEQRVLIENVTGVAFRYYGRQDLRGEPAWLGAWTRADGMPMLVELTVTSNEGGGQVSRPFVVDLWLQSKR